MGKRLSVKFQDKLLSELTTEIPSNGIITIGNDNSATIELIGENIAPEQFVLVCELEQIILMCRVDGTIINGSPASRGAIHNLQDSDVISVGKYSFYLENDDEKSSPVITDPVSLSEEKVETEPQKIHESKSERTLTDVIKTLRSEEKFYFEIEFANGEIQRLFVENDESFFGKNEEEPFVLTEDKSEIENAFAQVRKDWSGVVLVPLEGYQVWLENNIITNPHRLKNGDILFFSGQDNQKPDSETFIKFHEPTSLLVLDSILPKELPLPISLDKNDNSETETDSSELNQSRFPTETQTVSKTLYFGYFTTTEIIIMIIGTLITAAIIFMILELY
jgi:pSer/pThr/pTyr-binding forkhead associated (FHA) protein